MKILTKFPIALASVLVLFFAACSKTESYTDLLKKEQRASNWFLAQQTVCNEIPADSVFITGANAPYYKMDDDGYVYMQVISAPAPKDRDIPSTGDQVYLTLTRWNVYSMYSSNSLDVASDEYMQDNFGYSYFIFNNYGVSSSSSLGSGIQIPVSYLGYNSEVNILLKSYYGFSDDSTTCIPYKVNVRYFKAEY